MKVHPISNQAFRMSCEIGLRSPEIVLKIAQRFNAGFRLGESPKSLQGRQNRGNLLTLLSSLKGLRNLDHTIFPALKRWAIFGNTDADCCSEGENVANLRLAS